MGSGKSTLGKVLAQRLRYRFIDMDKLIVEEQGMTVSEIFAAKGENFFRDLERIKLRKTCEENNIVVSTGGGVPCFYNNMEYMNNKGITIYLKMDAPSLTSRLAVSRQDRPLIKGKTRDELLRFIQENLVIREPYYSKAMHVLESKNLKVEDLLEVIPFES